MAFAFLLGLLLIIGYAYPQTCTSNIDSLRSGYKSNKSIQADLVFKDTQFSFDNATSFNDKSLQRHVCCWESLGNMTNATVFGPDSVIQPKQVV